MSSDYREQDLMNPTEEDAINIAQIFDFFYETWRKALIAGIGGALIGVSAWIGLTPYKSEAVLVNNGALTFLSWRNFQKSVPLLASQLVETGKISSDKQSLYKNMSNEKWWSKNVIPTYSLTKSDTKDLASIGKELQESEGSKILNLVVTTSGKSKDEAMVSAQDITKFIKFGLIFLSTKNVVNRYESDLLQDQAKVVKTKQDTEIELKYMHERENTLKNLAKEFPSNSQQVVNQQVLDPKESSSKFLAIGTQLVAIRLDIEEAEEKLKRMNDKVIRNDTMLAFIKEARPLIDEETSDTEIVDKLLKIVNDMIASTKDIDVNRKAMLNDINADLINIRTSFTTGLNLDLVPAVTKKGPIAITAGSFVAGVIAFLFYVLLGKMIVNARLKLRMREVK